MNRRLSRIPYEDGRYRNYWKRCGAHDGRTSASQTGKEQFARAICRRNYGFGAGNLVDCLRSFVVIGSTPLLPSPPASVGAPIAFPLDIARSRLGVSQREQLV